MPKVLFYYSALASFFITASMVLTSNSMGPVIFATLFLPVTAYFIVEFFKNARSMLNPKEIGSSDVASIPRLPETLVLTSIFLLLLGASVYRVYFTGHKINPISVTNTLPTSTPLVIPKNQQDTLQEVKTLTITITDGSESVNVRNKPTIFSDKIGVVKDGEVLVYSEKKGEWYQITLENGSVGYLSFKYVKENTN